MKNDLMMIKPDPQELDLVIDKVEKKHGIKHVKKTDEKEGNLVKILQEDAILQYKHLGL